MSDEQDAKAHLALILERYADRENIGVLHTPPDVLVDRYLSKVASPQEFRGKKILELGAGCSQYIPVFLQNDCAIYYANDLIPERLAATRVDDPRYIELPGDFLAIDIPEKVDVVFASLTMMFLQPMLTDFVEKIASCLNPGGVFLSMDPNYFCPLSIYRHLTLRTANSVRVYNPFRYAKAFERAGFVTEKLVPFTAPLPWTTGNWLLGTTFWLKARKQ